jgi:cephalosporin hydroxylase
MLSKKSKSKNEKVKITVKSIYKGHHLVTYRGVKAIRCPFDYVIYQMIITSLKPDLVIEIGTNIGGGALYIADLMELIGHGEIHTIDISKQSDELLQSNPRIKIFTEGWENYDLGLAKGFEKILVIEDASHTYENTLAAIKKFAPLVTKDSYLIVEDGIINALGMKKQYHGGPLKAIREFLDINKDFTIDRNWCDMFGTNATFNVNGYLKKVS